MSIRTPGSGSDESAAAQGRPSFDECGFRPADTPCECGFEDEHPAATIDDLYQAVEDSHKSLGKIGEGDWTPQDSAHMRLLTTVEKLLASGGLRPGRIIHGDA